MVHCFKAVSIDEATQLLAAAPQFEDFGHLCKSPPHLTGIGNRDAEQLFDGFWRRLHQPTHDVLRSHTADLKRNASGLDDEPSPTSGFGRGHGEQKVAQGLVDLRALAAVQDKGVVPFFQRHLPVGGQGAGCFDVSGEGFSKHASGLVVERIVEQPCRSWRNQGQSHSRIGFRRH